MSPMRGQSERTPSSTGSTDQRRCIVITMQHPAHFHFFKHAIATLEADGHEVHVFVRDNEVIVDLLERSAFDYTVLVDEADSLGSLALAQLRYVYRLYRHVRPLEPDVIAGVGGVTAAHVATLLGTRSVAFTDTEHATVVNRLTFPFADTVCTPACFRGDVGDKHVRYPGMHELAYLHPDRFEPDPSGLAAFDVAPDDTYVVLRVSAWDSSHDIGQSGFDGVEEVIERLEATGARVLVSSEIDLDPAYASRLIDVDPHRIHDLLYYADLYVGEGATMAAESAVLGTPAVYVNSLEMGYMHELDDRYGLLFAFTGRHRHPRALTCAQRLLEDGDHQDWQRRRARLLETTVDVTDVIVDVLLDRPVRTDTPDEVEPATVEPTERTPVRH